MAIFLSGWIPYVVILRTWYPVPVVGIQRKRERRLIRQFALNRAHAHTAKPTGHDDGDEDHRAGRPNILGAAGPAKLHADAPTPSDTEEKPPAPASKKHSGDPEAVEGAPASKKPADATEKAKAPPASKKHAKDPDEAKKPPASKKPKVAATKTKAKAKKTPASPKSPRKTKKETASSKPAPKKPAAKQLPKKKGPAKEVPKTPKLPPKRTMCCDPTPMRR
ncbi:hypothetical protein PF005_g13527 [Phytophthora fragariae]|uniref:Uncharacterized protein n=1 Tax=Phytophthora fragariae TaxID=53985 RepID=A0A6A3K0S9_9STRA|nr:hypothetical protein PF011_g14717 [Phytophthora fragariae]KAE9205135.1 hypothetical protein PF005_g13527 [Phytophthora fragariae]KAE9214347.1 hypothetical protein PF004_g15071 [Phytophthora fragariae]KAE9233343.1 hypothetical protein PF002_g12113 [Phytophthora fragariae]